MLTYFAALKAEKVFTQYRALTIAYWRARPPDDRDWTTRDLPAPENEASVLRRAEVLRLFPEADACANELGLSVTVHSYPMPAVGGPVIPVNVLYAVMDDSRGHAPLPQRDILDTINRCLATATAMRKKLFWTQFLNPVWWVVEVIAYFLRVPFLILRRAGLPPSVEESTWGHVMKALFFIILVLLSLHWGLKLSPESILKYLK